MSKIYQKIISRFKNPARRNFSGFTLVELLVVVLIIGILVAAAYPKYMKAVERSRVGGAFAIFRSLRDSVKEYQMNTGQFPTRLDELGLSFPDSADAFPSKFSLAVVYAASATEYVALGENMGLVLNPADNRWKPNIYLIYYSPRFGSYMFFLDTFKNTENIICAESKSNKFTPCKSIFGAHTSAGLQAANENFY